MVYSCCTVRHNHSLCNNNLQHGRTALHVAGNVETARALIAAGADLNARDEVRETSCYYSSSEAQLFFQEFATQITCITEKL